MESQLSRRDLLLAVPVVLLGTACQRGADKIIATELGDWKIWGRKDPDGRVDYTYGEYEFEFIKRTLLIPRKYPLQIIWDFDSYQGMLTLEKVNSKELYMIGAFRNDEQKRRSGIGFISQWSHTEPNPDLTFSYRVKAFWRNLEFNKVLWNGKIIIDR